jgi:hypothetical protein
MLDLAEIKSRINPAYADRRGSESHERKMLCDEIERLRAALRHEKDVAEAYKAEADALRKDAERYRLLRRGQHWSVINGIGDELRADDLDAAINAVMKGGE